MYPVNTILPLAGNVAAKALSDLSQSLPFAQFFHADVAGLQENVATSGGTPVRLDSDTRRQHETLLQNARQLRDQLHIKIVTELQQRGINTDEPIALTEDADGRLLECSGSWDRTAIEQLFEENSELAGDLRQLFQQVQTLRRLGNSAHGQSTDGNLSPVRLWMEAERASIQILS